MALVLREAPWLLPGEMARLQEIEYKRILPSKSTLEISINVELFGRLANTGHEWARWVYLRYLKEFKSRLKLG